MKQTYLGQIFSGFFLVFWVIAGIFAAMGLLVMLGGYDLGIGDGRLLFWFTALIVAAIFVVNYFHPEQRFKRGER